MLPVELITDGAMFDLLQDQCNKLLDPNKALPNYVFRRDFAKFTAFDCAHIRQQVFGATLKRIALAFGDISVHYMTIEPDPVKYYWEKLGFYGAASFDVDTLPSRYIVAMSRDFQSADSFLGRGGDVGVFWGSSLQWGIFCDRISWSICVLALSGTTNETLLSDIKVLDKDHLRDYILNEYKYNSSAGLEFLNEYLSNYA